MSLKTSAKTPNTTPKPRLSKLDADPLITDRLTLDLSTIRIRKDHRPLNHEKVRELKSSVSAVGMLHPIAVYRRVKNGKVRFYLASGRTRLEVLKELGHARHEVVVIERKNAKLWMIVENLHRYELSQLQRSRDLVRYSELVLARDSPAERGGAQPHNLGVSAVARQFGVDRGRVRAAFRHKHIQPASEAALVEAGLENNACFLDKVAAKKSAAKQLEVIRTEASRRKIARPKKKLRPSDAPSIGTFLSDFKSLEKVWAKSEFSSLFERSSKSLRIAFVRKTFLEEVKKISND